MNHLCNWSLPHIGTTSIGSLSCKVHLIIAPSNDRTSIATAILITQNKLINQATEIHKQTKWVPKCTSAISVTTLHDLNSKPTKEKGSPERFQKKKKNEYRRENVAVGGGNIAGGSKVGGEDVESAIAGVVLHRNIAEKVEKTLRWN